MESESKNKFIAHVRQDGDNAENWLLHDLAEHCIKVGELARKFAGDYGEQIADLAGQRHDLGKYRDSFQKRIRMKSGYEQTNEAIGENAHIEQKAPPRASHSNAGAIQLYQHDRAFGTIFAYLIAGHHTGLPDWTGGQTSLSYRLGSQDNQQELEEALQNAPDNFKTLPKLNTLLPPLVLEQKITPQTFHVWVRFLFSCLVDADFLDTEQFMSPDITAIRGNYPSLALLNQKLKNHLEKLQQSTPPSPVNTIRNYVLERCYHASQQTASIFTLTVPTGGGKTLSSMAFALQHAIHFNKKRVIYAIPFTSIIEQNAHVFKSIFETDNSPVVIEHHSNLEVSDSQQTAETRLASENWDAPIIVTTNVQLFESLFASRTSQCRKIHNITNSVIVLDEAQKIPRDFQKPITEMMTELSKNYGVTWVLCTATQPKLDKTFDSFGRVLLEGLPEPYAIIEDEEQLVSDLERVKIHFPPPNERLSWQRLAERIAQEDKSCVLAIVNTRSNAKELFTQLQNQAPNALILHLSASMCPSHRKLVIVLINRMLVRWHTGEMTCPIYVVSTQLIEAGVDVDFPIVYRAMAGLDSIAQSAGRCNREGKLNAKGELGKVVVFETEKDAPNGELRQAQYTTREILTDIRNNPLSPHAFYRYFNLFNTKGETDKHGICEALIATKEIGTPLAIKFRTVAEKFSLIDNKGVSVICLFYHQFLDTDSHQRQAEIDKLLTAHLCENWLKAFDNLAFCSQDRLPVERLLDLLDQQLSRHDIDKSYRWIYRQLQQYTITIPERIYQQNQAMFYTKAGLIVAKDYNLWQGVIWENLLVTADDLNW